MFSEQSKAGKHQATEVQDCGFVRTDCYMAKLMS